MIRKHTGEFLSFDGTPIYYEVRGKGRPMVMCYGLGCLMNHWQHQVKYFSQTNQVILIDYRGHQKTPKPQNMAYMSIDALAKDLIGLLGELGFAKADFWGHSFGTQVLLRAYELNSKMFNTLIFVNGFASDPVSKLFGIGLVPQIFSTFRAAYEKYPQMVQGGWRTIINNPLFIPIAAVSGGFNLHLIAVKDIEIYSRGIASTSLDVFIPLFEDLMRYDARPMLDTVKVPTLIIAGEKDSITPPEYQVAMHKAITGSELQVVPYGSHCTQLDFPDFVNLRVEKFLYTRT